MEMDHLLHFKLLCIFDELCAAKIKELLSTIRNQKLNAL